MSLGQERSRAGADSVVVDMKHETRNSEHVDLFHTVGP